MNLRRVACALLLISVIGGGTCNFFDSAVSLFNFAKDQTLCRLTECCNDRGVPRAMKTLEMNLRENVYGQHIIMGRLIPALQAHLLQTYPSRKPLVLSFQGLSGTGKNFVSQQIAEAMFVLGLKSKFVRYYRGRTDFPSADRVEAYNEKINSDIRESLRLCEHSLFIFDEVNEMPKGIFKALTSLMDYNTVIDGQDSSKAIVILLSNSGGEHISNRLGNFLKEGKQREETMMSDYEGILRKAAYNMKGGMEKSSLIEAYVIDHYIPFLPLEKRHVIQCIATEFKNRGIVPNEADFEAITEDALQYDPTHGIFVISGCKTISPKVAFYVQSKYRNEL